MAKKIICPYCFKPFNATEVQMQCENRAEEQRKMDDGSYKKVAVCPSIEDKKYDNHWGTRVMVKNIFNPDFSLFERLGWKPFQQKKCPRCGVPSQRFVCPHCHNWLPSEMIEKGAEIISVIGGPASGKSNYIVALIHELQKYKGILGLSVTLQQVGRNDEEKTNNMYRKAQETIFNNREALSKTQETKNPIPWIIRLESLNTQKAVYLVFYDTAGESFRDTEKMQRDALYFRESKAVIVAFDTLAIPSIKKILEKNEIETYNEAYDYKEMWNTIMNFNHSNKNLKLTERPYAFVFTKFDAVINNAEDLKFSVDNFVDGEGNFRNSSYQNNGSDHRISKSELKDCSDAISTCLHDADIWDEDSFATEIENAWKDNGMFFGVSALGGMTDDMLSIQTKEEDDPIKPVRVLDPLVWILIKLGDFGIQCKP